MMRIDIDWPDVALKRGLELAISVAERPLSLLDVGAHYGETFNTFYQALPEGFQYIGFEPDPETYNILKSNVYSNGLDLAKVDAQIINKAVGPTRGVTKFHRTTADAVSGVLAPEIELNERVPAGDHIVQEILEVEVESLDDVIRDLRAVNLLKIDTEGFDLECLKGASSALGSGLIDIVLCETFFVKYRVGQAYFWDIAKFLESYGYLFVNNYDCRETHQGRMYTANGIWVSGAVGKRLRYL